MTIKDILHFNHLGSNEWPSSYPQVERVEDLAGFPLCTQRFTVFAHNLNKLRGT